MKYIANKYLEEQENATPLGMWIGNTSWAKLRITLVFGLMSTSLYTVLYYHHTELTKLAQVTYQGNKVFFFVPIVIALVFSLAHGLFTSHFWEALGIKHKQ